ncbi:MAG: hypothetical protein E7608_05215 [Ruminococcaceae bacterium]|nr:hypothetical protein [Oscillospiraceae bacterium]
MKQNVKNIIIIVLVVTNLVTLGLVSWKSYLAELNQSRIDLRFKKGFSNLVGNLNMDTSSDEILERLKRENWGYATLMQETFNDSSYSSDDYGDRLGDIVYKLYLMVRHDTFYEKIDSDLASDLNKLSAQLDWNEELLNSVYEQMKELETK